MGIGFTGFGGANGGGIEGVRILPPAAVEAKFNPPTTDEFFSSVSLLLHMDGDNGSTTFEDKSSNGFSVNVNGDAQISTAESKTSGASLRLDGAVDYINVATNSVFDFGTSDFTVECWWYWINLSPSSPAIWSVGSDVTGMVFRIVDQKYYIYMANVGGYFFGPSTFLSTGTWYHTVLQRSGTDWTLWHNGVLHQTLINSSNHTSSDGGVDIGSANAAGFPQVNGYIDEFRITKGVARYSGSFTPPTEPYGEQ